MSDKPNGGSAYPGFDYLPGYGSQVPVDLPNGHREWMQFSVGMSLRDYFAGQALIGHLSNQSTTDHPAFDRHSFAQECYLMADAMIAERSK